MYRYYSTQRPVAPGTYPGRPATLGNYGSNGTDIDYLGRVWGWRDDCAAGQAHEQLERLCRGQRDRRLPRRG